MKNPPRPNHRAVLSNPGPARNTEELLARQTVTVRVVNQAVNRPERTYERGETFTCTLAEARALGSEVRVLR